MEMSNKHYNTNKKKVNSTEWSIVPYKPRKLEKEGMVHKGNKAQQGIHWLSLKHLLWIRLIAIDFLKITSLHKFARQFLLSAFADEENWSVEDKMTCANSSMLHVP